MANSSSLAVTISTLSRASAPRWSPMLADTSAGGPATRRSPVAEIRVNLSKRSRMDRIIACSIRAPRRLPGETIVEPNHDTGAGRRRPEWVVRTGCRPARSAVSPDLPGSPGHQRRAILFCRGRHASECRSGRRYHLLPRHDRREKYRVRPQTELERRYDQALVGRLSCREVLPGFWLGSEPVARRLCLCAGRFDPIAVARQRHQAGPAGTERR